MSQLMEKQYVVLKGDNERIKNSVEFGILNRKVTMSAKEIKKQCEFELNFFQLINPNIWNTYASYFNKMKNVSFSGKNIVIKPYSNLFEALKDGIMGTFSSGYCCLGLNDSSDEFVFSIKIAGIKDKAFGYVVYDNDGNIKEARSAFNLNIENKGIIQYLELFSKDVLVPFLTSLQEKTA